MCGSATLAIVVSSTCMMVPSITATVSRFLCLTTIVGAENVCVAALAMIGLQIQSRTSRRSPRAAPQNLLAEHLVELAVAGVDADRSAHAGLEQRRFGAVGQLDADGHALHDLHPVAGGVLRRD